MPLGINRADLNKTETTAKDGSPVTLPHNAGNVVNWTPSPSHFGNKVTLPLNVGNVVDWSADPAHFGNKFASVDLPLYIGGASAHPPYVAGAALIPTVVTIPYNSLGGTTLLLKYYISNAAVYYPQSVVDSNGVQWDIIDLYEISSSQDTGGVFGILNSAPITSVTVTWGAPPTNPGQINSWWTYMARVEEFSNVSSIGEVAVNNGNNIGTSNPNPVAFPQTAAGNLLTGMWLSGTSGVAPSAVAGTTLDFSFAAPLLTIASGHGTTSPIAVNQNVSDKWLGLGIDLIAFGNPIPPVPVSVTPPGGAVAGGTFATLTGRGFLTGATVVFRDDTTLAVTPATNVVVLSQTTLTCTAPAGIFGHVGSIIVTNPNGKTGLGDGLWDWSS